MNIKMTFDEFHSLLMLQGLKRMQLMENFEIQVLINVSKESGPK